MYNSADVFEYLKETLFFNSWQLVADQDNFSETETIIPVTLLEGFLNEHIILIKSKSEELMCLSNVCTHRGNLLVKEKCKLNQLVCKYHGRRFDLKGQFISMPEFKEVCNFPSDEDHLKKLAVFTWGKLIFTSLHPKVEAKEIFGEIQERLHWFPMDKLILQKSKCRDYPIESNWALYCENYLEGFHIPFVHAGLNDVLDFGEYTTELFPYSNLQIGIAKDGDDCFELPESSIDYGKKIAGYYFWAYPNLMLNFYPWGLSVNIVKPTGVNQCKVCYLTYVFEEKENFTGAGGDLHTVEMEDEEIVESVQLGVQSRLYSHGRYSVNREQGTHHFHRLLSESLKAL
ncbi:MAG: Rieske 2Fe-2S domain-containing protein [Sphingobacteriaceae bacterium]|nr:Rieske 2Fe-2S domain-containing protein [Sphingobacteriaceae bacterium]